MAFDHVVHHMRKNSESGMYQLSSITPFIRLGCRDGILYMRAGLVWDESGEEVKNPPSWFYDEAAKLSPHGLSEVGFKEAPKRPDNIPAVKVGGPETEWQCPDCHKVVSITGKEQHIAAHNRRRGAEDQMKA